MSEAPLLDKIYDPSAVEPEVYRRWETSGAFQADPARESPLGSYTIVIPPPNVTGALHLGHALNNTLQDILIRYHRMRGFNTLWQPGTDHAGIATQAVVERRIREQEGKTRYQLGATEQEARDELVRRIWQWKDDYEKRIISQLKLMGCSCDWSRSRFTLDDGLARAVRHMFFNLFKAGLIFRGKRLVNWDTQLQTAVSDDEVYYGTVQGHFWYFKYPVIDPQPGEPPHVIIATTRPETMLADVAVAVHPDPEGFFRHRERELGGELAKATGKEKADLRQKLELLAARRESHLSLLLRLREMAADGRKLRLPLVERIIPLITDEWADPTLGTGCVKITPAHDPNDYEVGLRHKLPMINILTPDGRVARIVESDGTENPHSKDYAGLEFSSEGRKKVVADLETRGLLHGVEARDVEISHSDRSKLPIEPFLSDQWFLKTEDAEGTKGRRHGGTEGAGDGICLGDGSRAAGLAQAAMEAVEIERIRVFPPRYAKTYLDWLGEKRDWCISRQLWWGHRIPIWHRRVALTEENWVEHLCGEAGIDSLLVGQWVDQDASLAVVKADTGEPIDPRSDLMPVVAATVGAYDIYVACSEDAGMQWLYPEGYRHEPDVLDTWFSSALWPFSTLGWPEQTEELRRYYPGSVLCTSRDIITNWVARMVMFGLFATGEIPFKQVYIHPKILDGRGETMSKSKGNGVDPVDIIHTHGADALRYSLADMTSETQDIRMPVEYVCPHCGKLTDQAQALKTEEQDRKSRGQKLERKLQPADCARVKCVHKECGKSFATQWAGEAARRELPLGRETSDKFDIGRNFCNKLWNAARYATMNLANAPCEQISIAALPPEDRWILARLSRTIRRYHECIASYQFSASVKELRDFFWDSLCDWYIELTKPRLSGASSNSGAAKQVLALCLDQVLRLWHPTIPFITENLWQQLNAVAPRRGLPGIAALKTDGNLILAQFPPLEGYPALDDEAILATFAELQDATRGVRDLRSQCGVSPKERVTASVVVPADHIEFFQAQAHIVRHMAGIGELHVLTDARRPRNAASITKGKLRIFVHDISNDEAEKDRAAKQIAVLEKQIAGAQAKLSNAQFVAHADPEVVEAERRRMGDLIAQRTSLHSHLSELNT